MEKSVEHDMETWNIMDKIGIMEKKMETTIMGYIWFTGCKTGVRNWGRLPQSSMTSPLEEEQ